MNYSEAARIQKQGLSSLLLQNYARGESSPVRKAISDRLKATGTNIVSKFDPLNLVKMMTGSDTLTTIAGLLFKRDPRSIDYFTGRRTYPVGRSSMIGDGTGVTPVASFGGKKTIKILKKMYAFMQKARAEDEIFKVEKSGFMRKQEQLRSLRNDQLVAIFLNAAYGIQREDFKDKMRTALGGKGFLKLIAFFGIVALLANLKSIQETFENDFTAEFDTVKQQFDDLKIGKVVTEIEEFVGDIEKQYKEFEKNWNSKDVQTQPAMKPVSTATAQPKVVPNKESGLLNYIGKVESGGSYTKLVGGKEKKDLTKMTVGEVLDFQSTMLSKGHESTAIGKYQIIKDTLQNLLDRKVVKKDDVFNEATQDRLALALLKQAGMNEFKTGKITKNEFLDGISKIWAGVPFNTGRSYYSGVGSNKSLSTREEGLAAVQSIMTGENLNRISTENAESKKEMQSTTGETIVINKTDSVMLNKQMVAPAVKAEPNPIIRAVAVQGRY